jgi:6,7-dimethyl-8-ribityllumazine synthase
MSRNAPSPGPASGSPPGTLRIGIVAARYNERLVDGLLERVSGALRAAGVRERALSIVRVPGSNEVPVAVQMLARRRHPHVVIALGVLIRGGTIHYELIADSVAHALQRVSLDTGIPVINGVVAVENEAQARARCIGRINRGAEFAAAALAMARLGERL